MCWLWRFIYLYSLLYLYIKLTHPSLITDLEKDLLSVVGANVFNLCYISIDAVSIT